jgi:hypothetical protein
MRLAAPVRQVGTARPLWGGSGMPALWGSSNSAALSARYNQHGIRAFDPRAAGSATVPHQAPQTSPIWSQTGQPPRLISQYQPGVRYGYSAPPGVLYGLPSWGNSTLLLLAAAGLLVWVARK